MDRVRVEYSFTVGVARVAAIVAPTATVLVYGLLGPKRTLYVVLASYSVAAVAVTVQPSLLPMVTAYVLFVSLSHMVWPLIRTVHAELSRTGSGAKVFAVLRVVSEVSPRVAPLIVASTLYLAYYVTGTGALKPLITSSYLALSIPLIAILWASAAGVAGYGVLPSVKGRNLLPGVREVKGLPSYHLLSGALERFCGRSLRYSFGTLHPPRSLR